MKINMQTMLEQEKQFELDLSYAEYLRETNPPLSSDELDDMEKVFCESTILKPHKYLKPLNNLYYQPLRGA